MNDTQAPLPFTGQKRRFLNDFKTLLKQHIPDDGAGWTIIDAFGGNEQTEGWQNVADYQKISVQVTLNKTARYEDNMVFKF